MIFRTLMRWKKSGHHGWRTWALFRCRNRAAWPMQFRSWGSIRQRGMTTFVSYFPPSSWWGGPCTMLAGQIYLNRWGGDCFLRSRNFDSWRRQTRNGHSAGLHSDYDVYSKCPRMMQRPEPFPSTEKRRQELRRVFYGAIVSCPPQI